MTIEWKNTEKPSCAKVAKKLKIPATSIDSEYGFILVDPEQNTYAFLIDENIAANISNATDGFKGPFSNPRIEPFDLQE